MPMRSLRPTEDLRQDQRVELVIKVFEVMEPKIELDLRQCFFFQAEDGIRDIGVTGVQTCALPISPHLGASTPEAQDKAGTAVAHSVRLALEGEFVPDAVNVQAGGVVAEDVRPGLPLAEKLGRVFTAVAGGLAQSLTVDVRGKLAEFDVSVVQLAVLKGVFSDVVEEQVTYVNAPLFAEQRGLEVALTSDPESPTYRNLVRVHGAMADGTPITVSGTLYGKNQVPRLTEVAGFEIDLEASGYLLFFVYTDRPGVVGTVG